VLIGCSETRTVSAQSALFVCCCEHSRCVQNFSALIRSVQFDKLFTSVMYNEPTFVQRRFAFAVRGRVFIEHDVRRSPKFVCVSICSPQAVLLQGGYIFYAGGSLAGAGYCRQCHRRPAILLLQLWQSYQVCVKLSAQRLPRVAQFNACWVHIGLLALSGQE